MAVTLSFIKIKQILNHFLKAFFSSLCDGELENFTRFLIAPVAGPNLLNQVGCVFYFAFIE